MNVFNKFSVLILTFSMLYAYQWKVFQRVNILNNRFSRHTRLNGGKRRSSASTDSLQFLSYVKDKKVEPAIETFKKMKQSVTTTPISIDNYSSLFHLFHKAEHLEYAEKLFAEMLVEHNQASEQSYLALMRCYCDKNDIDKAWMILNEVLKLPLEPRLRTFQPLLEGLCKKRSNPYAALEILHQLHSRQITPNSDQIAMFLITAYQEYALQNTTFFNEVKAMIDRWDVNLSGFYREDALRLNAVFTHRDVNTIIDQVSAYTCIHRSIHPSIHMHSSVYTRNCSCT